VSNLSRKGHSFIKKVDKISMGDHVLEDFEVDFGVIDPNGQINGLLGLDILMKIGSVIDLKNLVITTDM
jgi:hypothetical protein